MAMYQVQMVNNVKTLVPVSGDVSTDSVTDNDMHPVTSNAVADALSYSAIENVAVASQLNIQKDGVLYIYFYNATNETNIEINNVLVGVVQTSAYNDTMISLIVQKGDVVKFSRTTHIYSIKARYFNR